MTVNLWKAAAVAVCLQLCLSGCSAMSQGFADGYADAKTPDRADRLTCAELAAKAVEISGDKAISLVKVRKPKVKKDKYDTYKLPTGDKEALILSCTGTAVWSTGDSGPVLLKYTIDADGDVFYAYEAQ